MKKRLVLSIVAAMAGLTGLGALLAVTNPAPAVPAVSVRDVNGKAAPYVVKLHAQWCPVCMVTKGVWAGVQERYAGRVKLVVFDFTNTSTTEASRAEARRLGLETVFDDYLGETGTVLVLDGASKEVRRSLHGNRNVADYQGAIDAVLDGKGE